MADPRGSAAGDALPDGVAEVDLHVDGRALRLTSLDRVLWPSSGFTKRDMVEYYRAVASALLPHLRDRPMTLGRFPEGIAGRGWYQTNCRGAPPWMTVAEVPGRRRAAVFRMCVVDDLPSLLWVVNQGVLELHPMLAPWQQPDHPTVAVFDFDPGAPATIADACRVALDVREMLVRGGSDGWCKTTGGAGLHLFVPVPSGTTFDATKAFARGIAAKLAAQHPDRVIDRQRRDLRAGRVLIDWLQNDPTRSTVAAYSLRAASIPLVSTPVTWAEVETTARGDGGALALAFGPADVLERVRREGAVAASDGPVALAPTGRVVDSAS